VDAISKIILPQTDVSSVAPCFFLEMAPSFAAVSPPLVRKQAEHGK
jgi:hypothetical protein